MKAGGRRLGVVGALVLGGVALAHAQSGGTANTGTKGAGPAARGLAAAPLLQRPVAAQATLQVLPPELLERLRQPQAAAPAFHPAARKLQRLSVDLSGLALDDLGAPFRVGPGVAAAPGRDWSVAYASFGSGTGPAYVFADERFQRNGQLMGRAGISFAARQGARYLIDCAVAAADELEVDLGVPGVARQTTRQAPAAGLVSVVTPVAGASGPVTLGLRAVRASGAFWDWHGCEVTPLG